VHPGIVHENLSIRRSARSNTTVGAQLRIGERDVRAPGALVIDQYHGQLGTDHLTALFDGLDRDIAVKRAGVSVNGAAHTDQGDCEQGRGGSNTHTASRCKRCARADTCYQHDFIWSEYLGGTPCLLARGDKHDSQLLVPSVERHIAVFGRPPRLAATDRGFFSIVGEQRIRELGVNRPAIRTAAIVRKRESLTSGSDGFDEAAPGVLAVRRGSRD
jgi:hypothetical protein